jgi:peptidyl-prolyl cis-trans isomerase B (cyclophilin B)
MVTGRGARVASKSNRQRQLERARAERRLARRAEQQRRRRQVQAAIGGAVALIVVAVGSAWLLGAFDSKPEPVALPTCTWTVKDPKTPGITETGVPPDTGEPRQGSEVLTIKTDLGAITASMDLSKVPCTAASLKFLGSKGYYDGVACNHLDTTSKVLTCGDPAGDGTGTPSYQFPDENLPTGPVGTAAPLASASPSASPDPSASAVPSYYSRGTIVMANQGANANGGQFFIVYGDGSDLKGEYSIVGTVTSGLDLVEGVAAAGVEGDGAAATAGKPKKPITIQQLYVGEAPASASPSVSPSGTPSVTPSAS